MVELEDDAFVTAPLCAFVQFSCATSRRVRNLGFFTQRHVLSFKIQGNLDIQCNFRKNTFHCTLERVVSGTVSRHVKQRLLCKAN